MIWSVPVLKRVGKCSGVRGFLYSSSCLQWRTVPCHITFTMLYYQTLPMWNWNIWSLLLDQSDLIKESRGHTPSCTFGSFRFQLFPISIFNPSLPFWHHHFVKHMPELLLWFTDGMFQIKIVIYIKRKEHWHMKHNYSTQPYMNSCWCFYCLDRFGFLSYLIL